MRWLITIICVTHVQKDFKIRTLIKQILTKYQISTKLPQILPTHKNWYSLSIIGPFLCNCSYPINFMAGTRRSIKGIHFFIFAMIFFENLDLPECNPPDINQKAHHLRKLYSFQLSLTGYINLHLWITTMSKIRDFWKLRALNFLSLDLIISLYARVPKYICSRRQPAYSSDKECLSGTGWVQICCKRYKI